MNNKHTIRSNSKNPKELQVNGASNNKTEAIKRVVANIYKE